MKGCRDRGRDDEWMQESMDGGMDAKGCRNGWRDGCRDRGTAKW